MDKEIKSFQENIRRTFIIHSLAPVIGIVTIGFLLFIISWIVNIRTTTHRANDRIMDGIDSLIKDYNVMMEEEAEIVANDNIYSSRNLIYSALYNNTIEYDDIGDLIILSPKMQVLFSSKDRSYNFLTGLEFSNWGPWKLIKRYPNVTKLILYDGKLCLTRGIFVDNELKYAIVYVVPDDAIQNQVSGEDKLIYITDKSGWVYLSNNKNLVDNFGQIDSKIENAKGYLNINRHKYYSYRSDSDYEYTVYTVSDIERSLWIIALLISILTFVFVVTILISYRSAGKSSVEYTKDVKEIENVFESVQQGDFDVKLAINSSKEFQTIGKDFNDMVEGLKTEIRHNNELAEQAAFSQVKQLESQFNPHFLFNTLDNIRFMAKIDSDAADKMIVSLSGLLRYSIKETKEEVTVEEDLKNLQYYFNILQIRFNKRFAYILSISEDIYDCLIPKLVIQPLIENAIKYGFKGREKLTVRVTAHEADGDIVCVCEDDGAGINPSLLQEIQTLLQSNDNQSSHLGLYNIHRRIQLMYKGEYGLSIISEIDKGTKVTIKIPMHKQEESDV